MKTVRNELRSKIDQRKDKQKTARQKKNWTWRRREVAERIKILLDENGGSI
jgi:hypothetical protein